MLALVGCNRADLPGDPFANAVCESSPAFPHAIPGTSYCRDDSWSWVGLGPEESASVGSAVWGRSSDDAWFVFKGPISVGLRSAIDHFDGTQWTREWWSTKWGPGSTDPDDLYAIWGSADDDLWVVGESGTILHSTGSGCWFHVASDTTERLTAVAGRGRSDVIAVGKNGASVHWDGSAWHEVASGVTSDFAALTFGGSFLWATTTDGKILRWDGASFTSIGDTATKLGGIWAASDDDAWAVGDNVIFHFDGNTWSPIPVEQSGCTTGAWGVWGTSATDVWFSRCEYGLGAHWDGAAFTKTTEPTGALTDGWGYHFNGIDHFEGGAWKSVIANETLRDVAVVTPDDVWAVSSEGSVWHFDGIRFSRAFRATYSLYTVAANGGHVWVTGAGAVLHFDGTNWNTLPDAHAPAAITSLWASAPDDVFIAEGYRGVEHWDGTSWSMSLSVEEDLTHVWGSARDDVWAFGTQEPHHFDGASWSTVPLPLPHGWTGRPSGSARDLWLPFGTNINNPVPIAHWDGMSWTVATIPSPIVEVDSVSVRSANDMWINAYETVYHWDGNSLSCAVSWQYLHGMDGPADNAWVVGANGTAFRHLR
jgi:hypothetical protein